MSDSMLAPEQRIRQRYAWCGEADRVGDMSLAYICLGVSRKTFCKWRIMGDSLLACSSSLVSIIFSK